MNSALEFDHVTFRYPGAARPVLENFCLTIEPGARMAILGQNGAGKTTLLHLALGWLKPQAGSIRLAGKPLSAYRRQELGQQIGLVPQSEHSAFEYSLLEFVLLGRAPYLPPLAMPTEQDVAMARRAIQQVGLSSLETRSILNISGGERQLVLMARALAQQPGLLLLDEPTSHLDLGNKVRLMQLLRECSAQGVTVVFTTHEPEFAAAMATHLVLMQKGQILNAGYLDEVFNGDNLTQLYQAPVTVVELQGRKVALW